MEKLGIDAAGLEQLVAVVKHHRDELAAVFEAPAD